MISVDRAVNAFVRLATGILCDVEREPISTLPRSGPLIVVGNHINWLDAPLILPRIFPRPAHIYAKIESFERQPLRFLFEVWNGIPVRRGEADIDALRAGLEVLERGRILVILPEGTRSHTGQLLAGKPGVVTLALRSGAPILPMVWYGHEAFDANLRRLRRTKVRVSVGSSFLLDTSVGRVGKAERQQITDEIMYQIAALLPPFYRGVYSDLGSATETFLRFPPGAKSNLSSALEQESQMREFDRKVLKRRKEYGTSSL